MSGSYICFFIGTEAELIKQFPVMLQIQKRGLKIKIIASGQNDIIKSKVLKAVNGGIIDVQLSNESEIKKSAVGLLEWFFKTQRIAQKIILDALDNIDFAHSIMVVHGDTISTVMGARIGKKLGMKVAHVEAGLRSHNILMPFPEEIDRIVTSNYADLHYVPGKEGCYNLKKKKGKIIDTTYNTVLDSLEYSRNYECMNNTIKSVLDKPYFVYVLHRQENLMNKALMKKAVESAVRYSEQRTCVFILHKPTEITLTNMGLLKTLENCKNIVLLKRAEYFDFTKLLDKAQFVITDGESNQEELAYMGKPCLIMRTSSERSDGLGENAILYGGDIGMIDSFIEHYNDYQKKPVDVTFSPSEIVAKSLVEELKRIGG